MFIYICWLHHYPVPCCNIITQFYTKKRKDIVSRGYVPIHDNCTEYFLTRLFQLWLHHVIVSVMHNWGNKHFKWYWLFARVLLSRSFQTQGLRAKTGPPKSLIGPTGRHWKMWRTFKLWIFNSMFIRFTTFHTDEGPPWLFIVHQSNEVINN